MATSKARAYSILLPRCLTLPDTKFPSPCRDARWSPGWRRNPPAPVPTRAMSRLFATGWRAWDTSRKTFFSAWTDFARMFPHEKACPCALGCSCFGLHGMRWQQREHAAAAASCNRERNRDPEQYPTHDWVQCGNVHVVPAGGVGLPIFPELSRRYDPAE